MDLRHLHYYEREVTFLRKAGVAFAKKYPKVALRLGISHDVSPDPHTERLIESFAFLTSYLQKDIDDQFPRIAATLLEVLYPQLITFIPPLSIAHFELDPSKGKATTGYSVDKNFSLVSTDGCRFLTCYPMTLWPIEVTDISVIRHDSSDVSSYPSPYPLVLKISLESTSLNFNEFDLSSLRFYMNTDILTANTLLEYLFLVDDQNVMTAQNPRAGVLKPVGFDENALPDFPQSHPAYRLLQEYFSFPQKFFFFDVINLCLKDVGKTIDLFVPLATNDEMASRRLSLGKNSLKLGCTPIINLFPKITDSLNLDYKAIDYPLVPDIRSPESLEIHSLQSVMFAPKNKPEAEKIDPYFSYTHRATQNQRDIYWIAQRVPVTEGTGTQMKISFVDLNFTAALPPSQIVYAKTLCSNRNLASLLPAGSFLQPEASVPTQSIVCLHQPTEPIYPSMEGKNLWRLVSQLSLNYLSLSSHSESTEALEGLINLYNTSAVEHYPLVAMKTQPAVRRIGSDAWRGFVKGTGVALTLDMSLFLKQEALLFASVLSHFLGLYASINSFVELTIYKQDNLWKTWTPVVGRRPLL